MKTNIVRNNPPPFDPAAWLARRYRISPAHARVIAELGGLGKIHTDRDASTIIGGAR